MPLSLNQFFRQFEIPPKMGAEGWEGHSYPGPRTAQASSLRHLETNTDVLISSALGESTPLCPAPFACYHPKAHNQPKLVTLS